MIATTAMAQCPQDTIVYGGNPQGSFNWSQGDIMSLLCRFCTEYNTFNCWQFPDTMRGYVSIAGNSSMPFGTVAVLATVGCHSVLFDTCGQAGHPFVAPMNVWLSLPVNAQVCVYWDSTTTDSVGVLAKLSPIPQAPMTTVILDMDTCDTTLPVDRPMESPASYHRLDSGKEERIPLPPGIYIETREGKRRLLFAR